MTRVKSEVAKLNNSYESEPSSGIGSSLLSNVPSDEENMHLPYLLNPVSDVNEVTTVITTTLDRNSLTASRTPTKLNTKYQGNNLCYDSFTESSYGSPFKGFSDSPFSKFKDKGYYENKRIFDDDVNNNKRSQKLSEANGKKPSPGKILFNNFFDIIADENSCNAVDNYNLPNEKVEGHASTNTNNSGSPSSELSFSGKIKNIASKSPDKLNNLQAPVKQTLMSETAVAPIPVDVIAHAFVAPPTFGLTEESSFILQRFTNEKSPDLFYDEDEEDDDVDDDESKRDNRTEGSLNQKKTAFYSSTTFNYDTESSFCGDEQTQEEKEEENNRRRIDESESLFQANCRRDKELLCRIRKCLAGVPPPPTMTIPQMDVMATVLQHKEEILNFHNSKSEELPITESADSGCSTNSLIKPTHTLKEAQTMAWKHILGVRHHGLSFNLNKASESNEYLSLSMIDRFVGAETASSYQLTITPSSTKKRNMRLKMLTASPGNRLSHLAKRRSIFSSAHLAATQQRSSTILGTQIQLDRKKRKNRRKMTPKRKTPGSKRKSERKNSSSSAHKLFYHSDVIKPKGQSRESSKRALFQSPNKTSLQTQHCTQSKPLDMSSSSLTRLEQSKRALFANDSSLMDANRTWHHQAQPIDACLLKRKRNCTNYDNYDASDDLVGLAETQNPKIFCANNNKNLTPRALKIKSESFCIGTGSSSSTTTITNTTIVNSKIYNEYNSNNSSSAAHIMQQHNNNVCALKSVGANCKLLRTQSENTTTKIPSNSLTENQRKKLLWAVSQALQEKKITAKHDSFKEFASVLARVVRRIFQEYYQKNSTSNSETMLRLAKKYAFNVINGRNVDDIYFSAKAQIDDNKRKSNNRLIGYIAPEEYANRKILEQQQQQHQQRQTLAQQQQQQQNNASMQNITDRDNNISLNCSRLSVSQMPLENLINCSQQGSVFMGMGQQMTQNTSQIHQQLGTNSNTKRLQSQSASKQTPIKYNSALQNSSSKNNLCSLALRENIDCEQRRSAQKNFTGKDQRNMSPFAVAAAPPSNRLGSAVKLVSSTAINTYATNASKARRQISFDN